MVSGSHAYLWEAVPGFLDPGIDNTTEDLVGLGAGFYTVIVTDENDSTCTATATFEIFEPVPFEVGIDEVGQVNRVIIHAMDLLILLHMVG